MLSFPKTLPYSRPMFSSSDTPRCFVFRRLLGVAAALACVFSPGAVMALAPAAPTNVTVKTTRVIADDVAYWLVTWDDNALDEAG